MDTRTHPLGSLVPVALLCAACFLLGLSVATAVFAVLQKQHRQAASSQLHAAELRIALLTQALATQSDAVIDLSTSPPANVAREAISSTSLLDMHTPVDSSTASPTAPPSPAGGTAADLAGWAGDQAASSRPASRPTAQVAQAAPSPPSTPPRRTEPARPAKSEARPDHRTEGKAEARPALSRPVAAPAVPDTHRQTPALPEAAAQPAPRPPLASEATPGAPPSQEAVAQARQRNRIEAVPPGKIGVNSIESGSVRMVNGNLIHVGQRFPSGERLLSVDPQLREIVTDARTILLL